MIAEQVVEVALEQAQGAQVLVTQSETTAATFAGDKLRSAETAQTTDIRVKVVVDGRMGVASTTDGRGVTDVVTRAVETAQFGSASSFSLPGRLQSPHVAVFDEAIASLSKTDLIGRGLSLKDRIKAYDSRSTYSGGVTKHLTQREFANSDGAHYSEESTLLETWALAERAQGGDVCEAWHGLSWRARSMDDAIITDRVIEMLRMAENTASVRSGKMPVIFAPTAMDVFLFPLRIGLDGRHVVTGYSRLGPKLGTRIVAPGFSLTDDPTVAYARLSSSYDDEGVPRRPVALVRDGVVRNFLYDLESAAQAGVESNGHGEGRETTNLMITPGKTPYEGMIRNTREGLLVFYVLGLGSGSVTEGDYSVGVRVGYKIENGEVVGRVKDTMIAGNAYDDLSRIVAMSARTEWATFWYTGCYPFIQVADVDVMAR